jgi:hypothetical protein
MCIARWFGGGGNAAATLAAQQQLAIAQQQQSQAAAAVAASKLDTESSRTAAEALMRKANVSQGFSSTLFGGGQQGAPSVAYKSLFGA